MLALVLLQVPVGDDSGFLSPNTNDLVALVGLLATVLGFAAAIWQIRRVGTAAKAAASAAESARRDLSKNFQLVDIGSAMGLIGEVVLLASYDENKATSMRLNDLRGMVIQIRESGRFDKATHDIFRDHLEEIGVMETSLIEERLNVGSGIDKIGLHKCLRNLSDFLNTLSSRKRMETGDPHGQE